MLEQEIASAIKYLLESAGNPSPYYYEVPEDFLVPSAYFPQPEIDSRGDTLLTYALEYSWFVMYFHKDVREAHALGFAALTALQFKKNIIPLIDTAGNMTGRGFRIKDPSLRMVDGAAQLYLRWDSPRPYFARQHDKMVTFDADYYTKSAFDKAVSQIEEMEA